jgi:ATP-dependent DNA helicase RecG
MNGTETPIQYLKNVGPKRAELLKKIGIETVRDLLFYFPVQYLDRSTILTSAEVFTYVSKGYDKEITVVGEVVASEVIKSFKKNFLKVTFRDAKGFFDAIWFNGIKYFSGYFKTGNYYAISAKPTITRYGHLQFVHPDFDRLETSESEDFLHTGKIIPFYRIPKTLREKNLGELGFRRLAKSATETFAKFLPETLPQSIVNENGLSPLSEAITQIHLPENQQALEKAWERIKFEEFFFFELLVALKKSFVKNELRGNKITVQSKPLKRFLDALPFELTEEQLKVLHEIRLDMESEKPMNRLLQGDVGSGKTIVALISILMAVFSGYQAAIMAPTEILANQHFANVKKFTEGFALEIVSLTGSQKKAERTEAEEKISSGKAQIVIGTHALFQENVKFKNLGLVVIDEQHRFGVQQRLKLMEKGKRPDVLIMTATPIPRTLSLTLYGDLDVSVISKPPANRKEIKTVLRSENRLPEIYEFVRKKIDEENYQAFVVYPLVEKSEKLEYKSAVEYYEKLKNSFLSGYKVGLLHGKMNWEEKEETMRKFAAGEFDALVSTTVIEVGIDVPNANIMIINDAERFGLSQLHQLRGRVGRGEKQAYCILVTKEEYRTKKIDEKFNFEFMSKQEIERNKTAIRLNAMVEYSDGFKLSEIDLKLRGPGDIFGTRQSGLPALKYCDLTEDAPLLFAAKDAAFKIIENDPRLARKENAVLKNKILSDYRKHLKFVKVG